MSIRLIMLGAPGSGKGTQAKKIAVKYKIPQISTGDLLRAAVKEGTPLGKKAKLAMSRGQLVSDEIVLAMIRERLVKPDTRHGFILDGFPRNLVQADALEILLSKIGHRKCYALLMDIDFDLLLQRLTGRRTCSSCGQMFNIFTTPPRLDDQCDLCGGGLRHRADDNEETVGNRLRVFELQTQPLVERFEEQGGLYKINGNGEIKEIFKAISIALKDILKKDKEEADREHDDLAAKMMQKQAERTLEKKAAAKQVTTKKSMPKKKVAAKKTVAKKTLKKAAPKKTAKKKAVVKKPIKKATKKVQAKKSTAKKKVVSKKTVKKKAVPKKTAKKKAVVKKPIKKATKKTAKKSTPKKKVAAKKTVAKKTLKKAVKKKVVKKATKKTVKKSRRK